MSEGQEGVQKKKFTVFSSNHRSQVQSFEKVVVLGGAVHGRWLADRLRSLVRVPVELTLGMDLGRATDDQQTLESVLLSHSSMEPSRILVHPGVGALARSAEFNQLARSRGVTLLGPSPSHIQSCSNRLHFLLKAESLGIRSLVLSREPLSSIQELKSLMKTLRTEAVVLKSVFHSGRAANLAVDARMLEDAPFAERFNNWMAQMSYRGGESLFFVEKFQEGARKILLPFSREKQSQEALVRFYSPVDRSLQSRSRVRVELCPPQSLASWVLDQMQQATRLLAETLDWVGLGATEWLIDGMSAELVDGFLGLDPSAFLWGKVSGVCPVAEQLRIHLGSSSSESSELGVIRAGVLAWIHAEDPLLEVPNEGEVFFSSRGDHLERNLGGYHLGYRLETLSPSGLGVQGEERSVLGKAWVVGDDLEQCLDATSALLEDVWLAGTQKTSLPLVKGVLSHPFVRAGIFHADFLESDFIPDYRLPESARIFFREARDESRRVMGQLTQFDWSRLTGEIQAEPLFAVDRNSGHHDVLFGSCRLTDGSNHPVLVSIRDRQYGSIQFGVWHWQFAIDPSVAKVGEVRLRASSSGILYRVRLGEGSSFGAGDALGWMMVRDESLLIPAPFSGRVISWSKKPGEQVSLGDELILLERGTPG